MAYNIGDNPTALTAPASGDKLKIHDVSAGDEKCITRAELLNGHTNQVAVPTTGTTVTCTATGDKLWVRINPAGTLANLQVDLPAVATAQDGQEVTLTFTQIITALVVDDNGATECAPAITAASENQSLTYRYHAVDDTWYLIGNSTT